MNYCYVLFRMILVPSGTSWRGRVEHGEAEQGFIHQVEWFAVQAKNLDDDNLSLSPSVHALCQHEGA